MCKIYAIAQWEYATVEKYVILSCFKMELGCACISCVAEISQTAFASSRCIAILKFISNIALTCLMLKYCTSYKTINFT